MTTEHALRSFESGFSHPDFALTQEGNEAYEIACQAMREKIERENSKPIPYENLKNFIHRPVFIVDGNVRCWTICDRVSKDFAHFSESVKCGVHLMKEGCGVSWFAYEFEPKTCS